MKVLILGATGATGQVVVRMLIERGANVRMVVRDRSKISPDILKNNLTECIAGNISEFNRRGYAALVKDCDAVISCLGHNISLKGIFGKPRTLVADCMRNVCEAIKEAGQHKIKVILMNTTANRNRKTREKYSQKDTAVLSLLRFILPPQRDNEEAAAYLAHHITEYDAAIEWVAVRPDTLINESVVTGYEIHEAPQRSPVFDAGKTSRVNVSHFMAELLLDNGLWEKWKFKMPVIYNAGR